MIAMLCISDSLSCMPFVLAHPLLDYWTGLLDSPITGLLHGLDYWTHPNCKIQLVQCRTETKLIFPQLLR